MKALLIGNGAREHCIAEALSRDTQVHAFMKAKNPGIASLAEDFKIGRLNDFASVAAFANRVKPDFVIVGPEDPLADGIADVLEEQGHPVVGPKKTLARLEGDKGFCREVMKKHLKKGFPDFEVCTDYDQAVEAIDRIGDVVVKAAGLAGGKGVKVLGQQLKDVDEAKEYAKQVLQGGIGKIPRVVIEEKLVGEEFSLQAFSDGKSLAATPLAQDHKHAFDGDTGPMTGGMGSYSDANHLLPFVSEKDRSKAFQLMQETIRAVKKETGEPFKGILYGGFMLTRDGPKILEYNIRFGDPEAMNVLPIMESSLAEVCLQVVEGSLKDVKFEEKATVCKYVVPRGYPVNPVKGKKIEVTPVDEARTYYASVDQREDGLYMSSSRAVAFLGVADTIEDAEKIAGSALSNVRGPVHYRKDIGSRELLEKRMEHVKQLFS
jgi:phosphoribosylamine--glycine ligase